MTLQAAVIGVGNIGEQHVAAAGRLVADPEVNVRAVVDIDGDKAAAVARKWGVRFAYDDYRRVLDDPGIHVVHICTHNASHFEISSAALDAGKHVVAEKPLGVNSTETACLSAAATKRPVQRTCVSFHRRYYPAIQLARQLVLSGDIGEIRMVRGSYLQDWLSRETDWDWRIDPNLGGSSRALADIGTHWSDLFQYVTNQDIAWVFADLRTLFPLRHQIRVATEDYGTVLFATDGDAPGVLTVSQVSTGHDNNVVIEVDGSLASLRWDSSLSDLLWIGRRGEPGRHLRATAPIGVSPAISDAMTTSLVVPSSLAAMLEDFYRGLACDDLDAITETTCPTFADGHKAALLVDAALRSARMKEWVDVENADRTALSTAAGPLAEAVTKEVST